MKKDAFTLSYGNKELTGWRKWAVLISVLLCVFGPWAYIGFTSTQAVIDKFVPMQVKLKKPDVVQTTNGQVVQEVKSDKTTDAQLKAATDSIFKLNARDAKRIKEIAGYKKMLLDIQLKNPVEAPFDYSQGDSPFAPSGIDCEQALKLLDSAIITPAEFSYDSDTLKFHGELRMTGVTLSGLSIPNYMYQRDVVKKKGFLNLGREYGTQIYNSNSLVQVDSMAAYYVPNKVTWWHKTGKPATAAVVASVATAAIVKAFMNSRK